ncbi:protein bric-a-brac 1-like isoform X2 [Diorhabda carinulata]|uniref:protein bric-a-brac 1-like isoform X2 n=1 Tax=Diorhabda carinulata TaxID=1163345 RepID=UPI0025A30406|nr:protein bric-a-brac 1-like isoform X2 [Diorhabda carinulata]XP_057662487.1 protein bric-a-brac 1-like isoform X2 [Diorhabda carinulata]
MEGEQFSLCWNNFHANLSSGFHTLFKDEDLVDVTLAAEGKFLKAHKTVLSVCSPFFKDLFRVNPCKHPIVILPDVNYNALCSLLQFMYQGEVSVSQEEIPTFMRVAEMLKVKGLTDNNPAAATSETNGYTNSNRNNFGYQDQRQNIMKRPRPVKKIIRPIQQLRPIESPKLTKSSSPHQPQVPQSHSPSTVNPPAKKPLLENDHPQVPSSTTIQQTQLRSEDYQEPLIKPKLEPIDHHDEENTSHSGEDPNMELSNTAENSQGEPSPSHSLASWPPFDMPPPPSQDSSSPGPMLVKSGRGQLVLIHNGHIYTLCDKKDICTLWICVKKKTLNCPGCLTTLNGLILLSYTAHNHPQMHDVIQKLQVPSSKISPELNI